MYALFCTIGEAVSFDLLMSVHAPGLPSLPLPVAVSSPFAISSSCLPFSTFLLQFHHLCILFLPHFYFHHVSHLPSFRPSSFSIFFFFAFPLPSLPFPSYFSIYLFFLHLGTFLFSLMFLRLPLPFLFSFSQGYIQPSPFSIFSALIHFSTNPPTSLLSSHLSCPSGSVPLPSGRVAGRAVYLAGNGGVP